MQMIVQSSYFGGKSGGLNWLKGCKVGMLECCKVAANEGAGANNEKTKTIGK